MKNVLRIIVLLIAVVVPHILPLPFNSYSLLILLIVGLFLKYDKTRFKDLGFSFSKFPRKALLYGPIAAVLIVSFLQLMFFPFLYLFIDFPATEVDMYNEVVGNTGYYIMMLAMGWLIGGLYEEIVFHGFIFYQLKVLFKGKYSAQISFLITALLFGAYHLQLGPADALNAFVAGAAYHLLALRFKGNLWYSVICHGTYNTIVITLLYLDYI